jgi:hypothetical protein
MIKSSIKLSPLWWHMMLLTVLAVIAFFPGLGSVHLFDWDEINFAEAAREMLVTGNYGHVQINFRPFYEKPPLFFWLQAWSMHIWGINEFAARFPNALFGVVTLLTLYFIGRHEKNSRFGLFWSLTHLSALLPHFYFKTGIIDPVFNYFIFLGIYGIVKLYKHPTNRIGTIWACIGGLSMGASILTKGPVGFLILSLIVCCYGLQHRKFPFHNLSRFCIYFCGVSIMPIAWLGYESYRYGTGFITNFIANHIDLFLQPIAGHAQPFYYHFFVVFLGCFPASILAIKSLVAPHFKERCTMSSIMIILFWVVMMLFSLSTTKIVHYSSLAYLPVSFFAAYHLYELETDKIMSLKWTKIGLCMIGISISVIFIALPIVALHRKWLYPFIHDKFILACMHMSVNWSLQDCASGCSYLLLNLISFYYLHRRWIFAFVLGSVMATTCCIGLATRQIIPKIEMHTQRPTIGFYKRLAGQAVYITTVGFKSYAPFFYGQISLQAVDFASLVTGQLQYPAYFVVKVNDLEKLSKYRDIILLYTEGGFAFLKRDRTI